LSLLPRHVENFNQGVRSGDWGPRYAWLGEPGQPAGELHLVERDGKIARLRVLYGQFSNQ